MILPHMPQIYARLHADQHGACDSGGVEPQVRFGTLPAAQDLHKKIWAAPEPGYGSSIDLVPGALSPPSPRPALDTKAPSALAAGPFSMSCLVSARAGALLPRYVVPCAPQRGSEPSVPS